MTLHRYTFITLLGNLAQMNFSHILGYVISLIKELLTKSKSVLFSDCPTDHPDTNSTGVKVTSTKIGTVLTYTCNSDPSITLTSKCRGDGTWTSSASSCTVSMPDLPGIFNQFKSFYDILLCTKLANLTKFVKPCINYSNLWNVDLYYWFVFINDCW